MSTARDSNKEHAGFIPLRLAMHVLLISIIIYISQSPWFSITSEDDIYTAPIDHVLFGGNEHLLAHTNAEYAHKGLTQRDRLNSLTKTYAAMVRAFENAGLDVFLESSCLIGYVRHNGNPIPWDMDIDIGFLEDECLNTFPNGNDDMYDKISKLLGPEYSVDKMGCDCGKDCEGDDGRMVGHVADKDTGFGVDIFSYARVSNDKLRPWQHDGRQWFERIRDRDDYTFPEEALLPLQNTTFAGVNGVLIPHNPRLFSSYEYGTNLEIHPFPWGFLAYSTLGTLGYCLVIMYLLIEFPDSWDDRRVPYWFYSALCLALFRGGLQSSVVGILLNIMRFKCPSHHSCLSTIVLIVFDMYLFLYVFRTVLRSFWAQIMEIFINGVRPDKVYTICIGSTHCYDFHL